MRPMSPKKRRELERRKVVVHQVHIRDGGCIARLVITEIECGFLPNRSVLEVDEIRGGSYRSTEWLDADRCQLLCPAHHDFKTDHKRSFNARIEAAQLAAGLDRLNGDDAA